MGRTLYAQYGADAALKALFKQGDKAPGAKEALHQALLAIATPTSAVAAKTVLRSFVGVEADATYHQKALEKINTQAPDEVLQSLQLDWKSKYKRMQYLAAQLDSYGKDNAPQTKAACHDLCKQILLLEQEIIEVWKQVDYYKANGKLEEVKEKTMIIPAEPAELDKRIEATRRYIRRHKQNATKHPENPKYPALVKLYEQQLQALLTHKPLKDGTAKETTI